MEIPTTIMAVDDDVGNLRLLQKVLEAKNYRVRLAPDGRTALTSARQAPPDLILLDLQMPEMDGNEVCEALKGDPLTADIPVLFLTGVGDSSEKLDAFSAGGVDYITKPFDIDELEARIGTHLEIARLQQALRRKNEQLNHSLEELQDAQDKLVEARTMEALNLMTRGLSHELNTPLGLCITANSALQGSLKNIARDFETNQLSRSAMAEFLGLADESVDTALDQAQQAVHLVEAMRTASTFELPTQERWFDLRACIEEHAALFRRALEQQNIAVELALDSPARVFSPPEAWNLIIYQLFSNALQYAFPDGGGGRLNLSLQEREGGMVVPFWRRWAGDGRRAVGGVFQPLLG